MIPSSLCPPSPFLYDEIDEPVHSDIEVTSELDVDNTRHIRPSIRANRLVAYLQSLKQDYELPEVAFVELPADEEVITEDIAVDTTVASTSVPTWLKQQMDAGKEVYMKAAAGGGMCFTCHQPNGCLLYTSPSPRDS